MDRRNFIKNTALGAAAITVPGTAIAGVDNWAMMDNQSNAEVVNKSLSDIIHQSGFIFDNMITRDVTDLDYHSKNRKYIEKNYKKEDDNIGGGYWEDNLGKYCIVSTKAPNQVLSLEEAWKQNWQDYVTIPSFVVFSKANSFIKAYCDIEPYIHREIISALKAGEYGVLTITQPLAKYDYKPNRKTGEIASHEKHGIASTGALIPNEESDLYAINVGIATFNKTMT